MNNGYIKRLCRPAVRKGCALPRRYSFLRSRQSARLSLADCRGLERVPGTENQRFSA